jgi:hypothetical protein
MAQDTTPTKRKPNILVIMGHRHLEPELLQQRHDGIPDSEHRPDCQRGDLPHRFPRRAIMHCRSSRLHNWTERLPYPDRRRAAEALGLRNTSNSYWDWHLRKGYMTMGAQALVSAFLETFKEFPPRHKAASFTIDQAMEKMEVVMGGQGH